MNKKEDRRTENHRSEKTDANPGQGQHRRNSKASAAQRSRRRMIVCVAIAMVLVLALFLYILGERYFRTHYVWGTTVNGNSVAGMTVEEVKESLAGEIGDYTLVITERTGDGGTTEETITGTEIGLTLTFDDSLDTALEEQADGGWLTRLGTKKELEFSTMVEYNEDAWEEKMDSLQCFQEDFVTKPEDAYLSEYQEGIGYEIVEAVAGNQTNQSKVVELLAEAVLNLEETINLEDYDCYRTPAVTSDDESLTELKENLEKYTDVVITYTFDETEEVLDGSTISGWLSVDEDNNVTLNADYVSEYVATLRKKYDTIFRSRTFKTTYGDEVTLDGGDYGWWMNYVQEAEELTAMIEAGESGERTPVYYQTAASYGAQDYGDTYVEVNLTAQHLYFYQDGEIVLESDFVSGNSSSGWDTPEGVYGITYKETNATLTGENYETPVSYWMPFNGNIGLHDATWRSSFGANLYKSSGSHGCINLPYLVAKELYSLVEKGTAVICYNLEGTESDSTTSQEAEEIAQSCIDAINNIGTVTKKSKDLIERAREIYNDLSSAERAYVDNYDVLVAAESAYAALS